MKFEWDPRKSKANFYKHRITFEEAETVFDDPNAMIKELTESDFAKGIKNPYFERLNVKVELYIRHELYKVFCETAEINGVPVEMLMSRCLADCAKMLQDHE